MRSAAGPCGAPPSFGAEFFRRRMSIGDPTHGRVYAEAAAGAALPRAGWPGPYVTCIT